MGAAGKSGHGNSAPGQRESCSGLREQGAIEGAGEVAGFFERAGERQRPLDLGVRQPGGEAGAILGGIVGAVAGRQISDRTGGSEGNKNVATVAGAVAGAAAGNAIQNRTTGDTYNITVRMDDGRRVTINQHDLGGVRENTYVRIQNGRVVIR